MHVEVSTSNGTWKEAVVIAVHSAAQGRYDVQYGDGKTEKYVSDKLIRHVRTNLRAVRAVSRRGGTSQSNLTVFRQYMELRPPEQREDFTDGTVAQLKGCHQELMRGLGNIYEEEGHRRDHR